MYSKITALGLIALVALVLASAACSNGGTSSAATADAEFESKVVCVTMKDGNNRVIEKARIKRLGERAFIVGETGTFRVLGRGKRGGKRGHSGFFSKEESAKTLNVPVFSTRERPLDCYRARVDTDSECGYTP